jgi:hypothetical protein
VRGAAPTARTWQPARVSVSSPAPRPLFCRGLPTSHERPHTFSLANRAAPLQSARIETRVLVGLRRMKKRAAKKKAEFEQMQLERKLEKELNYRKGLMAKPEADAPADVVWAGLGSWKETIAAEEKEAGGGKGKMAIAAENKARKSALNAVHNGVTEKIMMTLTEIASQLMTMTEDQVRSVDDQIGAVVNALNGVIMTYHMGAWSGH